MAIRASDLSPTLRKQLGIALPNKMHAKPTVIDGIRFDSKGEADRWAELQIMQRAGLIHSLSRQRTYQLIVNDVHIADYKADFVYFERGQQVVEDFKGARKGNAWAMFQVKRKLMRALYQIEVRITSKEAI